MRSPVELPDKYVRKDEIPAQESGPTSTGFNGNELIQLPVPAAPVPPGGEGRAGGPPAPNPAQLEAMKTARVSAVKQDFVRLTLGMFAGSFSSYPHVYYVGQAEAPQGKADVIEAKAAPNFTVRLFVNSETHLPIMVSWQAPAGRGGPGRGGPGGPGAGAAGPGAGPGPADRARGATGSRTARSARAAEHRRNAPAPLRDRRTPTAGCSGSPEQRRRRVHRRRQRRRGGAATAGAVRQCARCGRGQVGRALRPRRWNSGFTTRIIATSMGCSGRSAFGERPERIRPRRPHSIGSG